MGWTTYVAECYKTVGGRRTVDIKAELDKTFSGNFKVLKSAVVGSIYYAAVETIDAGQKVVYASIIKTSTDMRSIDNFSYKEMDEAMFPYYYDCPKSILELLTPTRFESANDWRKACYAKLKSKASIKDLSAMPLGTLLETTAPSGDTIRVVKADGWRYGRKRPLWIVCGCNKYLRANYIQNSGYKVIENK